MNNQFHIACILIYQLKKIKQYEKRTKNMQTTQKHRSCFQREKLEFFSHTSEFFFHLVSKVHTLSDQQ